MALNFSCGFQAQTALQRKWVQWKSAWGKTGFGETPATNNHFNYHTNSSIAETSRATVNLEHAAPAQLSEPQENSHALSVMQQENSGEAGNRGQNDALDKVETTGI